MWGRRGLCGGKVFRTLAGRQPSNTQMNRKTQKPTTFVVNEVYSKRGMPGGTG